jgi:16S rRNA (adenine1518-N6/adenine1519-N6)-dimethyltransferase
MTVPHPKQLLMAQGLRPKRHFGQNFLTDGSLVERIATEAVPDQSAGVVEIGAGLGALTEALLTRGARVVTIERDRDLIPILRELFATPLLERRLTLLEADAKTVDYAEYFRELPAPRVLAGNLPYQLTGPLLRRAVELAPSLDRAVFLVQAEVADRLAARAGTADYGALSVFAQAAFSVRRAFLVRKGAFYPQPNVDSAVVTLTPLRPRLVEETESFVRLVHDAFSQRRKQLKNSWSNILCDPQALAAAAERAGIDLSRRGEELTVAEFARMVEELSP